MTGAALFMARIEGGFLTNYLSDLSFPAWFYIHIRGLATTGNPTRLLIFNDWFGVSPQRALLSILAVGIISEVKNFYWPGGIMAGTFDYLDLLSYAAGLLCCYYFDTRKR